MNKEQKPYKECCDNEEMCTEHAAEAFDRVAKGGAYPSMKGKTTIKTATEFMNKEQKPSERIEELHEEIYNNISVADYRHLNNYSGIPHATALGFEAILDYLDELHCKKCGCDCECKG